ncbi:MAG: type III-B CRISPR module RAMP protein Cmr1 [Candidatus Aminicenantes bacterium]|nr:type III-B CRISPR module RAMP protein Cmr1 [Candidatus Aminicenantes bacterium]
MQAFIKVELISPAMIGGADSRSLDNPNVLRPPAVRGHLRFWTRALSGGFETNIKSIKKDEGLLLGRTESGQRLIFSPPQQKCFQKERKNLLPNKNIKQDMLIPNNRQITIRFRMNYSEFIEDISIFDKLRAVFWVWLHLGAIGRRSRRGFGSLQWVPAPGDFLDGFVEFNPDTDLATRDTLKDYLIKGLRKVCEVWKVPSDSESRKTCNFFSLSTIDQVFIGYVFKNRDGKVIQEIDDKPGGVIELLHGLNKNSSGEMMELGHAGWLSYKHRTDGLQNKLASPMMWRIFPCGEGFVPVMTWSPYKHDTINPGTKLYEYIYKELGFRKSLAEKTISKIDSHV